MPSVLILAAALLVAGFAVAVSLAVGQRRGRAAEQQRQASLGQSAEESSRRVIAEAERQAETVRKTAVLAGKEELMSLREALELDLRERRSEAEHEEKRLKERDSILDRKFELLDQREKGQP